VRKARLQLQVVAYCFPNVLLLLLLMLLLMMLLMRL
jgi:hypothetical protein